jgi:hypothetical protein
MNPAKKQAMLRGFDAFSARIARRYAEARACLEAEDFVGAQNILAGLTTSHARTSLSLRNVLIRDGLLEDDGK